MHLSVDYIAELFETFILVYELMRTGGNRLTTQ